MESQDNQLNLEKKKKKKKKTTFSEKRKDIRKSLLLENTEERNGSHTMQ